LPNNFGGFEMSGYLMKADHKYFNKKKHTRNIVFGFKLIKDPRASPDMLICYWTYTAIFN